MAVVVAAAALNILFLFSHSRLCFNTFSLPIIHRDNTQLLPVVVVAFFIGSVYRAAFSSSLQVGFMDTKWTNCYIIRRRLYKVTVYFDAHTERPLISYFSRPLDCWILTRHKLLFEPVARSRDFMTGQVHLWLKLLHIIAEIQSLAALAHSLHVRGISQGNKTFVKVVTLDIVSHAENGKFSPNWLCCTLMSVCKWFDSQPTDSSS